MIRSGYRIWYYVKHRVTGFRVLGLRDPVGAMDKHLGFGGFGIQCYGKA